MSKLAGDEYQQYLAVALSSTVGDTPLPTGGQGDTDQHWRELKETVYSTASEMLGYPSHKTPDWFWEHGEAIQKLLDEKRKLFDCHLKEIQAGAGQPSMK